MQENVCLSIMAADEQTQAIAREYTTTVFWDIFFIKLLHYL